MGDQRRGGFLRRGESEEGHVAAPLSSVRVLGDSAELTEAIKRAMSFEQATTERSREVLLRYGEQLETSRTVVVPMPEGGALSPAREDGRAVGA